MFFTSSCWPEVRTPIFRTNLFRSKLASPWTLTADGLGSQAGFPRSTSPRSPRSWEVRGATITRARASPLPAEASTKTGRLFSAMPNSANHTSPGCCYRLTVSFAGHIAPESARRLLPRRLPQIGGSCRRIGSIWAPGPAIEDEVRCLATLCAGVFADIGQSLTDGLEARVGFLVPSANAGCSVRQSVTRKCDH